MQSMKLVWMKPGSNLSFFWERVKGYDSKLGVWAGQGINQNLKLWQGEFYFTQK